MVTIVVLPLQQLCLSSQGKNCVSSVYETVVNMAVPVPSITLSRKLNTVNNTGVGMMDTNLQ